MPPRTIPEPDGFSLSRRVLAAFFLSLGTISLLAVLSAIVSGHSSMLGSALLIGMPIGGLFVSLLVIPMVICAQFAGVMLRVLCVASLLCLLGALYDRNTYPAISLVGGSAGVIYGVVWSWMTVPRYGPEVPDACESCGYSLKGLGDPIRCPECGFVRPRSHR